MRKYDNTDVKQVCIPFDPSSIFGTNNLQFPQAKKISKEKSQMPRGGNHLKTYPKDFKQSAMKDGSYRR
jgi:hypothetical protein